MNMEKILNHNYMMHEKDFEFLVEEGFSIPGMDEKGILVKGNDTKQIQRIKFSKAFLNKNHKESP